MPWSGWKPGVSLYPRTLSSGARYIPGTFNRGGGRGGLLDRARLGRAGLQQPCFVKSHVLLKSLAKKNRTLAEASWLNGNEEEARVSEWLHRLNGSNYCLYHNKVLLIKFSLACTLRDSIHSLKTIKTIWQKVKDKQPRESTAHELSFKGSQRRVLTTHPNVRTICAASLTAPCKTTKTSLLRWFFSLYRVEGQWKISWLYVHQGSERLNAPTWWWARLHLFRGCC